MPTDFIQKIPNLKHIRLTFDYNNYGIEKLLQKLSHNKNLQTVALESAEESDFDLDVLLECLTHWKDLRNLRLKVFKDWSEDDEVNFITSLPHKLSQLTQLRTLELLFYQLYEVFPPPTRISLDFLGNLPFLKKLTIKSRVIEPGAVAEVFKNCPKLPNIENININLNCYSLLKDSFDDLIRLIQNSNVLRVLKLPGLIIPNATFLKEITRSIVSKRILEKFKIGERFGNVKLECLLNCVEKISLMKGFKQFKIYHRKFEEEQERIEMLKSSFEQIMKNTQTRNYALNEISVVKCKVFDEEEADAPSDDEEFENQLDEEEADESDIEEIHLSS